MLGRLLIVLFLAIAPTLEALDSDIQWERVTSYLSPARYQGFDFPPTVVRYGGGVFVAMGKTIVAYSLDNGLTWQQGKGFDTNAPFSGLYFLRLIYGGDRFVAASTSGRVSVSSDGINWKVATVFSGAIPTIYDVAYGAGKYVAVGANSSIAVSSDGLSWEPIQSVTTQLIGNLTYGNGKFLAITGFPITGFLESTNALDWTARPAQAAFYMSPDCQSAGCEILAGVGGLAAVGGKFVMLGIKSGFIPPETPFIHRTLFWSDDGIVWAPRDTWPEWRGPGGNELQESNGELLPTSLDHADSIYVRATGIDLQRGSNTQALTNVPSSLHITIACVAANGNTIVGVGDAGSPQAPLPMLYISLDGGASFNAQASPRFTKVRYLNGRFVAVGYQGVAAASADGIAWTNLNSTTSAVLYDVSYGNKRWVIVGDQGIFTSVDGVNFSHVDSVTNVFVQSILYAAGKFVAGADSNRIITSTDGIEWAFAETELWGVGIGSIAYGNGRFVAGGNVSADGETWKYVTTAGDCVFANRWFYRARNGNEISRSIDGETWTTSLVDPSGALTLRGLDASDGTAWASGNDSAIWRPIVEQTQLRAENVANSQIRFSADVPQPGVYTIVQSTSVTGPWELLDSLNIGVRAAWTNSVTAGNGLFYRLKR